MKFNINQLRCFRSHVCMAFGLPGHDLLLLVGDHFVMRLALERFERDHAVRAADILVSCKGTGSGGHRRWLPQAMLRSACLGCTLASVCSHANVVQAQGTTLSREQCWLWSVAAAQGLVIRPFPASKRHPLVLLARIPSLIG